MLLSLIFDQRDIWLTFPDVELTERNAFSCVYRVVHILVVSSKIILILGVFLQILLVLGAYRVKVILLSQAPDTFAEIGVFDTKLLVRFLFPNRVNLSVRLVDEFPSVEYPFRLEQTINLIHLVLHSLAFHPVIRALFHIFIAYFLELDKCVLPRNIGPFKGVVFHSLDSPYHDLFVMVPNCKQVDVEHSQALELLFLEFVKMTKDFFYVLRRAFVGFFLLHKFHICLGLSLNV